eukprot:IDg8910t1
MRSLEIDPSHSEELVKNVTKRSTSLEDAIDNIAEAYTVEAITEVKGIIDTDVGIEMKRNPFHRKAPQVNSYSESKSGDLLFMNLTADHDLQYIEKRLTISRNVC